MKKINIKVSLAIFIGIILSLILVLLVNKSTKTADVTISFKNINDSSISLNLLSDRKRDISAFSIRVSYPGATSENLSFKPNPDLLSNGWMFPVNKVYMDNQNNRVLIDLSAINTNPTGYFINGTVELGTISVGNEAGKISSLTISIDKSQTKILDKEAKELNYMFITK